MSTSANAFLSVSDIVNSYIVAHGKTRHSAWKLYKLACDAVRELALSQMPLPQHKIISKPVGQTWFELPKDYTDYISVGIRVGERWRPVAVEHQLMPYPAPAGMGQYDNEFGAGYNVDGGWTNWLNPNLAISPASFNGNNFSGGNYNTTNYTPPNQQPQLSPNYLFPFFNSSRLDWLLENTGGAYGFGDGVRVDVVRIVPEKGIIMVPAAFPSNQLYLVYAGIGSVDTMTHVPIQAQATIEAYMEWKYFSNKRNVGRGEAMDYERRYNRERLRLAARLNPISLTDIQKVLFATFGRTKGI